MLYRGNAEESGDQPVNKRGSKESRFGRDNIRQIIRTIFIAGILIILGILIPVISLPVWGIALCVLAWGLKDVIPYPENYDTDYVNRYFKAQEDSRLYTRAILHQAYLHSGEIKILQDRINGKK